jgi:8-oxo-dGTP pyrophosphatase MutT (NUDIX family)
LRGEGETAGTAGLAEGAAAPGAPGLPDPPPWSPADGSVRPAVGLQAVRRALRDTSVRRATPWARKEPPGETPRGPQRGATPLARAPVAPQAAPPSPARAGVLVPLFEEGGEARVVLTRRSSSLRSHTGQVAFPGGRLDPGETPLQAALREADEEVAIDPETVEIIGELSVLPTVSSNTMVVPFVGALPGRPLLRPNPAEVERAFDVSLEELMADGVYRRRLWRAPSGDARPVHQFEVAGETVWGATARILFELLQLVRGEN